MSTCYYWTIYFFKAFLNFFFLAFRPDFVKSTSFWSALVFYFILASAHHLFDCVFCDREGKMVVLTLAIGLAEQDDFANLPDLQEAPADNETPPADKR